MGITFRPTPRQTLAWRGCRMPSSGYMRKIRFDKSGVEEEGKGSIVYRLLQIIPNYSNFKNY